MLIELPITNLNRCSIKSLQSARTLKKSSINFCFSAKPTPTEKPPFEALAEEKGICLTLDQTESATVKGNPDHLRYVIQNLLDNAIKYTETNGHIRVSLRKDISSNQAVLCVADTGIGISDEDQKKLGQRFFRCNSGRDPANTPRGSGLGLSIVLNIIESMQGNFEVKSQLGKGTKIHVSLPLYSSDQNEDDHDDQDTSGSSDYSSGISSPGLRSGNSVINIAESVLVNARNSSPKVEDFRFAFMNPMT